MKNRECRRNFYTLPLFTLVVAAVLLMASCTTPEKAKAQHVARGQALLRLRDYVIPDDIKSVAVPALAHRITLRPELWVRQVKPDDVVAGLLASVPTPRTDPSAAHA